MQLASIRAFIISSTFRPPCSQAATTTYYFSLSPFLSFLSFFFSLFAIPIIHPPSFLLIHLIFISQVSIIVQCTLHSPGWMDGNNLLQTIPPACLLDQSKDYY